MIDSIETVTRSALALALDAASLRQQVAAANIANVSVSGYVPQRVNFEAQLEAARQSLENSGRLDGASLAQVRPRIEAESDAAAGPVRLDVEVAEMARNAVQYQALLKGLSRHFAILAMAAGDGRK